MNIGEKIKYVRKQKEIKSSELATHLGFKTSNTITSIEDGRKSPTFSHVMQIAKFFEMDFMELVSIEIPEDFAEQYCRKSPSVLGNKIAKARQELGHSIEALGEASGISQRQLRMLEKGSSKSTSTSNALALARALGLDVEYLLDNGISVS